MILAYTNKQCLGNTALAWHMKLFEVTVMPFGLTYTPAIFQYSVSIALHDHDNFDDVYGILTKSSTYEHHY